jgi:ketosteroid isomerase-like protein
MTRSSLMRCLFFFGAIPLLLLGNEQIVLQRLFISDVDAVRQARMDQNDAMAIGDSERVASFWTDDITLRRGLGTSVVGKDAYRALIDAAPNEKSLIYVREPDFIEVSSGWPLAFESGTWTARCGSLDSPPLVTGRYSAQWVKREGYWFIRSELFVALTCTDGACVWPVRP